MTLSFLKIIRYSTTGTHNQLKRKVLTKAKGEVPEVVEDGVLYEYDQENDKLLDARWEPKDISLSVSKVI